MGPSERASVLREVASGFVSAGQQEAARAALEKASSAAEQIADPRERLNAFREIKLNLAVADLGEQAASLLRRLEVPVQQ